ncbi:hypothetical protein SANA_31820 [Gottschalkiaceae bacterium SANA]|nr:hypothetical protein SANA_31820 [Gottschalkiaceae bacterium SANA]
MYYLFYDKESNRLKNYYKLLGIPRNSNESIIHKRFAALHEEGKTNELIEEAYAVLSAPEDRDRYNRVYDRYNWNYGIQKNTLYENAKPKNQNRSIFIILLFVLIGFLAIAFFFLRTPDVETPPATMEEAAEPQIELVDKSETSVSDKRDQAEPLDQIESDAETSTENSEMDSSPSGDSAESPLALSISDELLTKYPTMETYNDINNTYPQAQVTAGVNFRDAPAMSSRILSSVDTDETFRVLGKVDGWSYIYRESEGYGWIGGKYIRFTQ